MAPWVHFNQADDDLNPLSNAGHSAQAEVSSAPMPMASKCKAAAWIEAQQSEPGLKQQGGERERGSRAAVRMGAAVIHVAPDPA